MAYKEVIGWKAIIFSILLLSVVIEISWKDWQYFLRYSFFTAKYLFEVLVKFTRQLISKTNENLKEGKHRFVNKITEGNPNSSASITYEQDEDDDGTYDVSSDDYAVYAPCTQWQVTSEDTIVCNDSSA